MPGGFIFDVELAAIKGAVEAYLAPYVASGATTQAKANEIGAATDDLLEMMNSATKAPPVDPGQP
jgi:hypothetical protein